MARYNIDVVVNPSGATSGAAQVNRALQGVEGRADRLDNRVRSLAGNLGRMLGGAAAAFSFGAVVNEIANFEQSMSRVQAITRATDAEMAQLRSTARELGATTEFSAAQAAEGLTFLGMAGFSAAESIEAIPAVLDLATAASMDLGRAADISSNIMSAFGVAADQATSVTDLLAAASSRANTDVNQLGDAMKYVGPIAQALGVSMNDTAAAIGVLSDAGIQGGQAGRNLRNIMSSLVNPTTGAQRALDRLGVSLADVNPETNDLTTIIRRLRDAGLDTASAMEIFGSMTGSSILALTESVDTLDELTEALSDVEGEAARMAETMRDNLRGDIDSLKSAVSGLILSMGDSGLNAVLRLLVTTITEVVRAFAWVIDMIGMVAMEFLGLGAIIDFLRENIDKAQFAFRALAAGVSLFLAALVVGRVSAFIALLTSKIALLGRAAMATGLLTGAVRALTVAIAANPLGAILVALTTLATLLWTARDRTLTFGDTTVRVGDVIAVMWDRVVRAVQYFAEVAQSVAISVRDWFLDMVNNILSYFTDMEVSGRDVANFLIAVFKSFVDITVGNFRALYNVATAVFRGIANVGRGIMSGLAAGIRGDFIAAGAAFTSAFSADSFDFSEFENTVRGTAATVGENFGRDFVGEMGASIERRMSSVLAEASTRGYQDAIMREAAALREQTGAAAELNTELERMGEVRNNIAGGGGGGGGRGTSENAISEAVREQNTLLEEQKRILDEINGPREQVLLRYEALNNLLQEGAISAEQYAEKMRDLRVEATALSNTFTGGLLNGLARVAQRMNEFGSMVSDWVVGAFDSLTEAIVNFAKTGEFNVRQFFQNLFAQLLRLATNMLFAQLINMFMPGMGSILGGLGGGMPGFATGGDFRVGGSGGTDSQLVAFKATPGERVSVRTPGQSMPGDGQGQAQEPAEVNLRVVNVTDPKESLAALETAEGERVLMNIIKRNPRAIRSILGTA